MTISPMLADDAVSGPPQGQWTVDDWERVPDDGYHYEIVRGVLYMTTAPSTFHQWIVGAWIRYVGIPAQEQQLGVWFTAPVGVLLSDQDVVQPDFVFIRTEHIGIIYNRRIRGAPDLVVEVLSPGNSTEDMDTKRALYARAGVPEYIEVDPAIRRLRCYHLQAPGQYALPTDYDVTRSLTLLCLPTITLAVAALFADAPDTAL